ncbi:MAG: hypothetical protein EOO22_00830 [Comamonadaceae bacterium]|nr:MAG: hypothetical protein EOO22_00830 [Comamonadaceae bacterium]
MDASQIGIVATAIGAAKDIGKAMLGVRDFNLLADRIAAMNDQLLKAQDALLAHNAAMFQLQSENFEAREELRKLKEAASERSRYTLVEITQGNVAYRVNLGPALSAPGQPVSAEAMHYLCQPCFDDGRKVTLRYFNSATFGESWTCSVCKAELG